MYEYWSAFKIYVNCGQFSFYLPPPSPPKLFSYLRVQYNEIFFPSPLQGAKIINWSHFESEYILGRKIAFICTAQGDPRPHVTWYKNGIELYGHSFFQVEFFLFFSYNLKFVLIIHDNSFLYTECKIYTLCNLFMGTGQFEYCC